MSAQVALLTELRWRLSRNALRTGRGRWELLGFIGLAVVGGLSAVGIGVGLGLTTFASLIHGRTRFLPVAFWIVFVFWQLAPVVLAGFAVEFEFRKLLHFPLRFSTFVLLSLVYGVVDPPSLVALFWTACVAAGILLAKPEAALEVSLLVIFFAAACLLLNRLIISWAESLLARKRTREVVMTVFLLLVLSVQLFGALSAEDRWGGQLKPLGAGLARAALGSPPGLVATSVSLAMGGEARAAWQGTAWLVAYVLVFGGLLVRRLRTQYRGESVGGEGDAPARAATGAQGRVAAGWPFPGMSAPLAALCEKELRYAMRNGQNLLSVIVPLMIVLFFAIVSGSASIHIPFLKSAARAGFFFPIAVAYSFVVFAPMLHNTLGFEGKGFQFLLMAPTRFESVLLAKNITHALLLFGDAGLVWLLVSLMLGVPPTGIVAMTLTGLLFLALVHFVMGNWLSIAFPRQLEFGHFRKRVSEMNALLGMVAQSASLGVVTAIYFQTRDAGPEWATWVATAAYLALSGVALLLYHASLKQSARLALDRREILTAELCR